MISQRNTKIQEAIHEKSKFNRSDIKEIQGKESFKFFFDAACHLRVTCTLYGIVNNNLEVEFDDITWKDGIDNGIDKGNIIRFWECLEACRPLSSIVAADFRRRGRWRVAPSTITSTGSC